MRRRPAAAKPALRKPAAQRTRPPPGPKKQTAGPNEPPQGEVDQLPWDSFKVGAASLFCGTYQGKPSDFVGEIKAREEDCNGRWLQCYPWGSPDAPLTNWVKAEREQGRSGLLKVHLCGKSCVPEVGIEGQFHCKEVKLPAEDVEWKANLLDQGDGAGLPGLAALAQQMGYGATPQERRKRENEAKARKEKDNRKERRNEGEGADSSQATTSSSSSRSGRKGKKEKRKAKKRRKKRKVKEMEEASRWSWKGTSLDPSFKPPKVSVSKPKASSSTDGTAGSDEDQLFPETQRVRKVAKSCPGLLSRQALKDAKNSLAYGIGESAGERSVTPVMLKYFRQILSNTNLTKSMQKEALTLCTAIDLILEGKVLRSMDVIVQRLKAIEMVAKGSSWDLAERVEITKERASLFSQAEASTAVAESKREKTLTWGLQNSFWTQDPHKGKGGKGEWTKGGQERKGQKGTKGKEKGSAKGKEQQNAPRTEVLRPT